VPCRAAAGDGISDRQADRERLQGFCIGAKAGQWAHWRPNWRILGFGWAVDLQPSLGSHTWKSRGFHSLAAAGCNGNSSCLSLDFGGLGAILPNPFAAVRALKLRPAPRCALAGTQTGPAAGGRVIGLWQIRSANLESRGQRGAEWGGPVGEQAPSRDMGAVSQSAKPANPSDRGQTALESPGASGRQVHQLPLAALPWPCRRPPS